MNGDEQKFEEFLRGFEPRRPQPLPSVAVAQYEWRRLAATAVIFAAVGGSAYVGFRSSRTKFAEQRPAATQKRYGAIRAVSLTSSVALTRIALGDIHQFDVEIDELAPLTFPCCEGPNSSLAPLAKP
jgi:hypothetical protein